MIGQRFKQWAVAFDWVLFFLVFFIALIGVLNLYSASGVLDRPLHNTQIVFILFGSCVAAGTVLIDYRIFERWSQAIYGFGVFLLFLVLIVGTEFNGSRRWLDVGPVNLQPSELMKLAIILITAKFFADKDKRGGYSLTDLITPLAIVALPMFLILKEPDLGTSVLLLLIVLSIAFFEGIKKSSIVIIIIASIAFAPVAWYGMKEYQQDRIKTFLQIEEDAQGRDWQVNQSVIAVGHGGLVGKGFGQGTQIQKGFVPEPENDFALANWAEEQGFIGAFLLLSLYLSVIFWAMRIARSSRDRFGMLVSIGVAAMIFWQVLINYGMVLRVMPVVGITLPLVSYGGSSVVTILLGVGLLMNISVRRHAYQGQRRTLLGS